MAKRGPKPKVTAEAKRKVYAMLKVGASLRDAAGCLGVDYKTLYRARKTDAQFANGVMKALREGKLLLLRKMGKARQWQAAAWMLERRWGKEFGRKDKQQVQVTGKIEHGASAELVRNLIADDESTRLANALAKRMAGHAIGDGQSAN